MDRGRPDLHKRVSIEHLCLIILVAAAKVSLAGGNPLLQVAVGINSKLML